MKTLYTFHFTAYDNGGGRQYFKIKAADKLTAIAKGMTRARKNARGDITAWDCKLSTIF